MSSGTFGKSIVFYAIYVHIIFWYLFVLSKLFQFTVLYIHFVYTPVTAHLPNYCEQATVLANPEEPSLH